VGDGGDFTVPSSGTLELRINDCDDGLQDNEGELRVRFVPSEVESR
jgi:hypothetical protein